MNHYRRSLVAAAGAATVAPLLHGLAGAATPQSTKLVLSDFPAGRCIPTFRGVDSAIG